MLKINKIINKCLTLTFDNFKYSYVAVSLVLMLNLHLFVFLAWGIVMIVAFATKTPSNFKIVKFSDLAKANLFLIVIWLALVFFHGYLVTRYSFHFPVSSENPIFIIYPIYPESLDLLRYCAAEFSNYSISYGVFMGTIDLLEILYKLFGEFCVILI